MPICRVIAALCLDIGPTAETLTRLRVVQDRVVRVDGVLGFDVAPLGGVPVFCHPVPGPDVTIHGYAPPAERFSTIFAQQAKATPSYSRGRPARPLPWTCLPGPAGSSQSRRATSGCQLDPSAELACMAGLACGKLSRSPACIIRGFRYQAGHGGAVSIIRSRERDLFR